MPLLTCVIPVCFISSRKKSQSIPAARAASALAFRNPAFDQDIILNNPIPLGWDRAASRPRATDLADGEALGVKGLKCRAAFSHFFAKAQGTVSRSAHLLSLATLTSLICHHTHIGQLCLFSQGKSRAGRLEHGKFNHAELANEWLAPMLSKTRIPPGVLRMC